MAGVACTPAGDGNRPRDGDVHLCAKPLWLFELLSDPMLSGADRLVGLAMFALVDEDGAAIPTEEFARLLNLPVFDIARSLDALADHGHLWAYDGFDDAQPWLPILPDPSGVWDPWEIP